MQIYISTDNAVGPSGQVFSFADFGAARPWTTALTTFQEPVGPYRIVIEARFSLRNAAIAVDSVWFEGENGMFVDCNATIVTLNYAKIIDTL